MLPTDKPAFAALIAKTWRFYDKTPTAETIADWFDVLESFPLDAIARAFQQHVTDPKAGPYLPKPADVIRHLPMTALNDGHPGADEAWGLLLRLVTDERETGVLTDEMRAGWQACQPILDRGDEVGARMCFLDVYRRQMQDARQNGLKAHWTPTLGTDPALRMQRLKEAVAARRIGADQARLLLPGQTPVSLDAVAGLLAGPEARPQERNAYRRFQEITALIHSNSAKAEQRRAEQRQQQREAEAEQRQSQMTAIEAELEKRGIQRGGHPQQVAA